MGETSSAGDVGETGDGSFAGDGSESGDGSRFTLHSYSASADAGNGTVSHFAFFVSCLTFLDVFFDSSSTSSMSMEAGTGNSWACADAFIASCCQVEDLAMEARTK